MPNAYAAETTENIMASEAAIHVQLQHRNVTRMYGFYNIGNSLYIVSELMDCTLDQVLHPPPRRRQTRRDTGNEEVHLCRIHPVRYCQRN